MKILITGTAGFIGFHLAKRLLSEGHKVIGLDNINNYYDPELKYERLRVCGINREDTEYGRIAHSEKFRDYRFIRLNLEDREGVENLFTREKFDIVFNLAAQAGVRYSIDNPRTYIDSNIVGFINILEECRHNNIKHLFYASSSSVYGLCSETPFNEETKVDNPVSLYAASKKANELMAHTYSHLYQLPVTGLRFFSVYGPYGRPDMALFGFLDKMLHGKPIEVYNNGDLMRDFTYVDDIVEGMVQLLKVSLKPNNAPERVLYEIFNIGNSNPVKLMDFIDAIEKAAGIEAEKIFLPMQPGDVYQTYADTTKLFKKTGYKPSKDIRQGVQETVTWYREYFNYPVRIV